jgi:hypothetical protein
LLNRMFDRNFFLCQHCGNPRRPNNLSPPLHT